MYVYLAAHFPYKVVIDITLFNKQNRKFDVTYLLRHQFFHTVKDNFIFRGTSNSQLKTLCQNGQSAKILRQRLIFEISELNYI